MSRRTHQITSESLLGLRFSERIALEMITTVLWPLHTDERIGLLLTTLADNVVDVAETDEEIDSIAATALSIILHSAIAQLHMKIGTSGARWQPIYHLQ